MKEHTNNHNKTKTRMPAVPQTRMPAVPQTRMPAVPQTRMPAVPQTRMPAVPQTRMLGASGNFFENFTVLKNTESKWNTYGFTK